LHDVGKTIDKNVEGPHALLGYDLTKKYNEHTDCSDAVAVITKTLKWNTPSRH
jgi:ribonuclease Y